MTNNDLGFPEFTRFFNHDFSWKLQQTGMDFAVTISAQQEAFIEFSFYFLPATRIAFLRYTEVFFCVISMMKFKSFKTSGIPADLAASALASNSFLTEPFPPALDRSY